MAVLRDPIVGCPWDKEQTHGSIILYVLEEAHEVADSIRQDDQKALCAELGDLLLQVLMHSQIAMEQKNFDFTEVVIGIKNKLIRRHPHVFAKQRSLTKEEVDVLWEEIKNQETEGKVSKTPFTDNLQNKVRSQNAVAGAILISKKIKQVGFDWSNMEHIWRKFKDEVEELKEAIYSKDLKNVKEELGDTIFTLVNIARWLNLNPEEAISSTNKKFLERFAYIESALDGEIYNQPLEKFEFFWAEAKQNIEKNKR